MPDPSILGKIMAIKPPTTKKQVRSMLGLIYFYSGFIPNYSDIVACLTELSAGGPIKWLHKHNEAFQRIQTVLNSQPFL